MAANIIISADFNKIKSDPASAISLYASVQNDKIDFAIGILNLLIKANSMRGSIKDSVKNAVLDQATGIGLQKTIENKAQEYVDNISSPEKILGVVEKAISATLKITGAAVVSDYNSIRPSIAGLAAEEARSIYDDSIIKMDRIDSLIQESLSIENDLLSGSKYLIHSSDLINAASVIKGVLNDISERFSENSPKTDADFQYIKNKLESARIVVSGEVGGDEIKYISAISKYISLTDEAKKIFSSLSASEASLNKIKDNMKRLAENDKFSVFSKRYSELSSSYLTLTINELSSISAELDSVIARDDKYSTANLIHIWSNRISNLIAIAPGLFNSPTKEISEEDNVKLLSLKSALDDTEDSSSIAESSDVDLIERKFGSIASGSVGSFSLSGLSSTISKARNSFAPIINSIESQSFDVSDVTRTISDVLDESGMDIAGSFFRSGAVESFLDLDPKFSSTTSAALNSITESLKLTGVSGAVINNVQNLFVGINVANAFSSITADQARSEAVALLKERKSNLDRIAAIVK